MPDWDLTGTREDLKVLFAVGYRVAQADKFPEWKRGQRVQGQARGDAEEVTSGSITKTHEEHEFWFVQDHIS